jgi:hypothetical protein
MISGSPGFRQNRDEHDCRYDQQRKADGDRYPQDGKKHCDDSDEAAGDEAIVVLPDWIVMCHARRVSDFLCACRFVFRDEMPAAAQVARAPVRGSAARSFVSGGAHIFTAK